MLRNTFFWKLDSPPPRNANNVKPYTFIILLICTDPYATHTLPIPSFPLYSTSLLGEPGSPSIVVYIALRNTKAGPLPISVR